MATFKSQKPLSWMKASLFPDVEMGELHSVNPVEQKIFVARLKV